MKKLFFAICSVVFVLLFSCSPNEIEESPYSEGLNYSVKTTEPVILNMPQLFPEGLEYDHRNDRFIVSVALQGTIGVVEDGEFSTLIDDNVLIVPLGTHVDQARNRLLVANADHGMGVKSGVALMTGGLAAYDLSGNLLFYSDFTTLNLGYYFPNDVVSDHRGNAYVTDSFNGHIYKVDKNGKLEVFFHDTDLASVPPNEVGLNGIEYDPRGFLLVAHTFTNRLIRIPVDRPEDYSVMDLSDLPSGPDGLYLKSPNELYVANNDFGGEEGQVQLFKTNDRWESAVLQEVFPQSASYPTTVTIKRGMPYVLRSYIHYVFLGMERSIFEIVPLVN